MKISKLISLLEIIKKSHGDLIVRNSSCHTPPHWTQPIPEIFTYSEGMEHSFVHADNEDLNIGDEFVWL